MTDREAAENRYMHGACHVLALALHEIHGFPIVGLWDEYGDAPEGHLALVHFFVRAPDGMAIDAKGVRPIHEVAKEFGYGIDDLIVQESAGEAVRAFSPVDEADLEEAKTFARQDQKLSGVAVRSRAELLRLPAVALGSARIFRAGPQPGAKADPVPEWLKDSPEFAHAVRAGGRWWTDDLDEALWYVESGHWPTVYVLDVEAGLVERHRVSALPPSSDRGARDNPAAFSRRPEKEIYLPEEYAGAGRLLVCKTPDPLDIPTPAMAPA